MNPLKSISGFSLVEVVATIALLAVLAAVSTSIMTGNQNAQRYEETRRKMELIRTAILGDEALDAQGQRFHFGFLGDMGAMPTNLTDLTTIGAQPAWAMDTRYGIGAGWRGPYYVDKFTTSAAIGVDAWGTSFSWTPSGTPTLTSFGSDTISGTTAGEVYSKDLTMSFSGAMRLSSVRGFVRDGDTTISGAAVNLKYPSGGAIVTYPTVTAADGSFTFQSVPFGHRAITVSSVPGAGMVELGPKQIAVAGPQFLVPNFLMNYFGSKQKISIGTVTTGPGTVTIPIHSDYEIELNINYITANWSGGAMYARQLDVSGAQLLSGLHGVPGDCPTSGERFGPIPSLQTFSANTPGTTNLVLTFRTNVNCGGGVATVTGRTYYLQFEWVESKEIDAISFST